MRKTLTRNPNYEIDNLGNIYSKTRNKKLTPKQNWDGYQRIQLWSHGKCNFVSLHTLIAEEFCEKPITTDRLVVNHKNLDKSDNRAENLEWITQKENIAHAMKNGHFGGIEATKKRLTLYSIHKGFIAEYESASELCRNHDFSHSQVCRLRRDPFTKTGQRSLMKNEYYVEDKS